MKRREMLDKYRDSSDEELKALKESLFRLNVRQAMAKNQHVVPHGSGWAVRGEGNSRPTSFHRTQAEAIKAAREIARSQHTQLVIHRSDGRVRDRDSYGAEPLPEKTPRKVLFPAGAGVTDPDKIRSAVREVVKERDAS